MEIKKVIILSEKEMEIINAALNNRMCYLGKLRDDRENCKWAEREWNACLDLQCEWFGIATKLEE